MNTEYKRTPAGNPDNQPPIRLPKHNFRSKQWTRTQSSTIYKVQDTRNFVIDQSFMVLVAKVRKLYEGTGTEAFELDIRHDKTFSSAGMHTFCTSDLYLDLACGTDLCCYVTYDFQGCKHQHQLLTLMNSIYLLDKVARPQPLKGGVAAFFSRVKQLHPKSCFSVL